MQSSPSEDKVVWFCLKQLLDTVAGLQGTWLSDRTPWDSRVDRVLSGREWGPVVDSLKSGPTWCCQDTLRELGRPSSGDREPVFSALESRLELWLAGPRGVILRSLGSLERLCSIFWNLARPTEQAFLAYQRRRDCMEKIPGTTADTSHQKKGLPRQPQWTSERRESPAENTWIT